MTVILFLAPTKSSDRRWWLTGVCLLLLGSWNLGSTTTNAQAAQSVQTSWGGKTFAGGMAREPVQDLIYVTGQVGINACFVGILKRQPTLTFVSRIELPEPAICQGVVVGTQDTTALLLATTEDGGLFTDTRVPGSTKATQYGMVVPLVWNAQATQATLPTGLLLHEDVVQYPRAMIMDPTPRNNNNNNNKNYVYVASTHSDSRVLSPDFQNGNDQVPNLTPGGYTKYGSEFFLQVERLQYNVLNDGTTAGNGGGGGGGGGGAALKPDWRKPFGLTHNNNNNDKSRPSVHVGNMIWNQGALLIVGSTRGSGPAFGTSTDDGGGNDNNDNDLPMMNGYLTKLDPTTGARWQSTKAVQRYSRGDQTETYIEAVCSSGPDATELFITGMYYHNDNNINSVEDGGGGGTGSENSTSTLSVPYIAKLDATTFELLWEEQFAFTRNAYGLSCGVDESNGHVYMAGIVEDGGTYGTDTASLGQDDVFVVQSQMADGHGNWIRQLGTQQNDRLAHGGSGLMVLGGTEGILIYGDTSGDLATTNLKGTEIFVAQVDAAGTLPSTTETSGTENNGGSVAIQQPIRLGEESASDGDGDGDGVVKDDTTAPTFNDNNNNNNKVKDQGGTGGGIGMIVAVAVLVLVLMGGYVIRNRKHEKGTERAAVFSYLHAFDLEDVDVRHSATGGWHGTYVGDLAKGEGGGGGGGNTNDRGSSSGSIGSLSHSSIVRDSLFVDYETKTPKFGGGSDDDDDDDDGNGNDNRYYRDHDDEEDGNARAPSGSFRIGSDDEEDMEDDDQDFEKIGRLAEEDLNSDGPVVGALGIKKPWGGEII